MAQLQIMGVIIEGSGTSYYTEVWRWLQQDLIPCSVVNYDSPYKIG